MTCYMRLTGDQGIDHPESGVGSIPTDTKLIRAGKASGSSSGSVKPIRTGVDRNRTCPPVTAVDRGGLEVWIHMAPYSAVLSGVDRPFSGTS